MIDSSVRQPATLTSLTERLLLAEDELRLFEHCIDGVPFWELVRFRFHAEALRSAGIHGQAHSTPQRSAGQLARLTLSAARNVVHRNPFLVSSTELVFFGHQRRKLLSDGKWWDIYCDPVLETLDETYVYLEQPYLNSHLRPAKTRNAKYLDLLYPAELVVQAFQKPVRLAKSTAEQLLALERALHARIGLTLPLQEMVVDELVRRKRRLPLYLLLLRRSRPRAAVVVVSHGKPYFVEACKTLEIPVVELQHGFIGEHHLGYSYPSAQPGGMYFPDYLLTFGPAWSAMAHLPLPPERVIPVGYPYFDMEKARIGTLEQKRRVVFISQGTIGKQLSRLAVEFSLIRRDIPVVYKLHPGEYGRWKSEYPWLGASPLQVVDDDSLPLYDLLATSSHVVGVDSTALFEGMALGSHPVLVDLPEVEGMRRFAERAGLSTVSSAEGLSDAIEHKMRISQTLCDEYIMPGGLSAMKRILTELVNGGQPRLER